MIGYLVDKVKNVILRQLMNPGAGYVSSFPHTDDIDLTILRRQSLPSQYLRAHCTAGRRMNIHS